MTRGGRFSWLVDCFDFALLRLLLLLSALSLCSDSLFLVLCTTFLCVTVMFLVLSA